MNDAITPSELRVAAKAFADELATPVAADRRLASAHRLIHQWRTRTNDKAARLDKALRAAAMMRATLRRLAREADTMIDRDLARTTLRLERSVREGAPCSTT